MCIPIKDKKRIFAKADDKLLWVVASWEEIKGEGSFILDYMIFMLFEHFSMCNYYFSKNKFIRVKKRGKNGGGYLFPDFKYKCIWFKIWKKKWCLKTRDILQRRDKG